MNEVQQGEGKRDPKLRFHSIQGSQVDKRAQKSLRKSLVEPTMEVFNWTRF
jgi:hypothetical protein